MNNTIAYRPNVRTARVPTNQAHRNDAQASSTTAQQSTGAQDSVVLSSAATNPLADLSVSQLEERAFKAKDDANFGMAHMFEGISGLPEAEQKEVGRSMFYETASSTGYYQTEGEGGQMRNMTATELRAEAAELSSEDRSEFQADVQDWAKNNEIPSQMAMAQGAVGWAAANFDENAPQARQDNLLSIAQSGQRVWNANNDIVESAVELNTRNPGQGTGLYQGLNEPAH